MKTKLKYVYYCDFCKKRYMTKSACEKHEKHCTLNQDRNCRLCDIGNTYTDIRELCDEYEKRFVLVEYEGKEGFFGDKTTIVPIYNKPFTLQNIKDDCEGCPNCILTAIRCLGLSFWYFRGKFKYDYRKDLADFWKEIGDREEEEAGRETYRY